MTCADAIHSASLYGKFVHTERALAHEPHSLGIMMFWGNRRGGATRGTNKAPGAGGIRENGRGRCWQGRTLEIPRGFARVRARVECA